MSSEGIENLEYETTGYLTDDTELIESSRFYKSLGNLSANNFIEIENADEGSFNFTIYFSFNIAFAFVICFGGKYSKKEPSALLTIV